MFSAIGMLAASFRRSSHGVADKSTLVRRANARGDSIALNHHLVRAVNPKGRRRTGLGACRHCDIVASDLSAEADAHALHNNLAVGRPLTG